MIKGIITTEEAAEILDVTQRAVQKWVAEGHIKGEKFKHVWMVDKQSVLKYKTEKKIRRTKKSRSEEK